MDGGLILYLLGAAYAVLQVLGLVSAGHAVMSVRTSQGAVAWAVSLLAMPVVAVPLYWVFGRNRFQGYVLARRALEPAFRQTVERLERAAGEAPIASALSGPYRTVMEQLAHMPFTRGNGAELLVDGEATFEAIFAAVAQAERYVLVQFYILKDDALGNALAERLIERARAGVRVYLLYDEIGSLALSAAYLERLRAAGVEASAFNTTQGRRNRFQLNFRNHRKIVVVDGRTAFIGGHNVGDEYVGRDPKTPNWRDTHVRIDGPAAVKAQLVVAEDWHWATRELLELDWTPQPAGEGDLEVLVLPSGPADPVETCGLFFAQAINRAERRLWIASPYFVPDESIVGALKLAALKGVDVRIILPDRSDNLVVDLATHAFIPVAARAGVKFYRYQAGFLHQKVMMVDDACATVGTANMDNRSFRLNFEVSALFEDAGFAAAVREMLEADLARCREVTGEDYRTRPLWFRIAVRAANLMSPIL